MAGSSAGPFEPDPAHTGEGRTAQNQFGFWSAVVAAMPYPIAKLIRLAPALLLVAAPAVAETDERLETLPGLVVEGLPVEDAVNPLVRPAGPLFGDARNLLDTPRAVTVLTEAFLDRFAIQDVRSLAAFVPSAGAPGRFGNLTTPNVRGDVAETYWNGQRRAANLFGYAPSFNGVESIEVVRGPATVVLGPGAYPGGFIGLTAKTPRLSGSSTVISTRLGSWVPDGGSYGHVTGTLDHNAPLGENLALRFSWEGQVGDTFYSQERPATRDDHQDFYAAVRWIPQPGVTVDANAQFSWQSQPQLLGVNRPSNALIFDGIYFTGTAPDIGGAFVAPWFLTPTGTTPLPDDALFGSLGDYSNANIGLAQVVVEDRRDADQTFTSRTMVETVNRRRHHDDEYDERVRQVTAETRFEWRRSFTFFGRPSEGVAGVALRYEERETYVNYFNEYFFTWDITDGRPVYDMRADYPLTVFPGLPGPHGIEFFGAAMGSPETVYSQLFSTSLFWQQETALTPTLRLFYGLRGDLHWADARDPLPLPGTTPWQDDHSFPQAGGHLSLTWRPVADWSFYATYARSAAVNVSVSGGGLFLFNGELDPQDFRNHADLFEIGARAGLLDNRLFLGVTAYHQERSRVEFRGGKSNLVLQGVETELVWQPRAGAFTHFSLTWFDGRYDDSAPFQSGGRSIYDLYAPGTGPGGLGTGAGWEVFPGANQVPAGDWRMSGESRWRFSAGTGWRPARGLGATIWGDWHGSQPGNLEREWEIPPQFTLNLSTGWRAASWEVEVVLRNATDETNWIHNGDTFMNNLLVGRGLPRRLELTATRRW